MNLVNPVTNNSSNNIRVTYEFPSIFQSDMSIVNQTSKIKKTKTKKRKERKERKKGNRDTGKETKTKAKTKVPLSEVFDS